MARTQVQWQIASPLWEKALKDSGLTRFNRPALLRFNGDDFMEDLEKLLTNDPSQLKDLVVRPETGDKEAVGWQTQEELTAGAAAGGSPLMLYHPAQARFYLVAASLVCRKPGFPDKTVQADKKETVSFVLRRLVNENGNAAEYGWKTGTGWEKLDTPDTVVPGDEERYPMFSMSFKGRDRQRRLLAGFLPVASRETFQAPAGLNPLILSEDEWDSLMVPEDAFADPRMAQYETTVQEAAEALAGRAGKSGEYAMSDEEARGVLLFICLDFAVFLKQHLPDVWEAVDNQAGTRPGLTTNEQLLLTWLHTTTFHGIYKWDSVLDSVYEKESDILSGAVEDPDGEIPAFDSLTVTEAGTPAAALSAESLKTLVENALGEYEYESEPQGGNGEASGELPEVPKHEPGVFYVVRCVYERPRCEGIQPAVISKPSREFKLASFFEPEAPARPIRITMPIETGIAGLRKFKKNVSVLISKKLRQQIERMKGVKMGDLDEGDIPSEPPLNLGMICSFSIPIITICALILLMIILYLLNIVFWWVPFFKICFPKKS